MSFPQRINMSKCDLPPAGWSCRADRGHKGPCAAWPLWPEGWKLDSNISNEERKAMWELHNSILKQGFKEEADALSKALLNALPPINRVAS
jgi:hypothetical protein